MQDEQSYIRITELLLKVYEKRLHTLWIVYVESEPFRVKSSSFQQSQRSYSLDHDLLSEKFIGL